MTKVEVARRGHKPDYILALVVFGLLATGLVMMYSISPILSYKLSGSPTSNFYFYNHLLNVVIGRINIDFLVHVGVEIHDTGSSLHCRLKSRQTASRPLLRNVLNRRRLQRS